MGPRKVCEPAPPIHRGNDDRSPAVLPYPPKTRAAQRFPRVRDWWYEPCNADGWKHHTIQNVTLSSSAPRAPGRAEDNGDGDPKVVRHAHGRA